MYVADNMVDILVVYNDLGATVVNEGTHQFLVAAIVGHSTNLRSGHHTVAYFRIGELQCILEYLHFILNLLLVLHTVNAFLDKIIEINFREIPVLLLVFHFHTSHPQEKAREKCGKARDGPEYYIEKECGKRKHTEPLVRIALEKGLRQELARDEHDEGTQNGICRNSE